MADKQQFPSEEIDLPSEGKLYPKDSPLATGKIEIKYMTAKEEDILTSENLLKKGIVIDKLLNSLILTKNINVSDLIVGDKNAVMVAVRILAYGPQYSVELENQFTGAKFSHTFDLTECPFKKLPTDIDYSQSNFSMQLPVSKVNIKYRLLTAGLEASIEKEIKNTSKFGSSTEMTSRLRNIIVEVDGDTDTATITNFVNNMLSQDSLALREEIQRISPDIILKQDVDMEGEMVEVDIPLTTNFFWPTTRG